MKKITLFYQTHCPFCKRAIAALDALRQREPYKNLEITMIEETEHPEIADRYDYYYVPTFYIDGQKVWEGGIYPNEVEQVLQKAL